MQVPLHSLDGLLRMHGGRRPNHHGRQARVLDHLVVVIVQGHPVGFEMLFTPGELRRVRGERGHQLRARGAVQEVQGMSLPYTTQAGSTDLELLDGHGLEDEAGQLDDIKGGRVDVQGKVEERWIEG